MIKSYVMGVINKGNLTLYAEDGSVVTVTSKTHNVASLCDLITPFLFKNESVEFDLDNYLADDLDIFKDTKVEGLTFVKEPDDTYTLVHKSGKTIKNIDKLIGYFREANDNPVNEEALVALINRLLAVSEDREHSVQDTLSFLKENSFPLTLKGDIIALKVLWKGDNNTYTDWYSKRVIQNIGSVVSVPFDYVDKDRHQTCSQGLHIASIEYAQNFYSKSNSDIFLVAVKPEDIITVPVDTATKVRVSSYFILDMLRNVNDLSSIFTDAKYKKQLEKAINGDWVTARELVTVAGRAGTNITVTPINEVLSTPSKHIEVTEIDNSSDESNGLAVAVKKVDKVTNKIRAMQLYQRYLETNDEKYMLSLKAIKSRAKTSWAKLGVPL